jgi:hypothetical protein
VSINAITITAVDQARMRSDYLRHSWLMFAIMGLFFVLGLLGAAAFLPSEAPAVWLILLLPTLAVASVVLILRSVGRSFALSYPVGSEHHLLLTEETLDIVGAAGVSQIRWENLAHLKRSSGAVHLTALPHRIQLVLPARLVTDEAFEMMGIMSGASADTSDRRGDGRD